MRYKKCAHSKCYLSILCLCICAYWFVLRKKSNIYRKTRDKNSDKTKRHFCGIIMVTKFVLSCISSASNLLPSAVVRSIILYIGEAPMEKKQWYKDRVFYQIWPRSFKASKGFDLSSAELILQNYADPGEKLQPYEVRVYLWNK